MVSLADLPDVLPDRTLTMDEAEKVALACGAEGVNRLTYDDPEQEPERRVWIVNLLVDGKFVMLSRAGGSWDVDLIADGLRDDEFYHYLDDAMGELFGVDLEPAETIWLDEETGEEIDRVDASRSWEADR